MSGYGVGGKREGRVDGIPYYRAIVFCRTRLSLRRKVEAKRRNKS